MGITKNVKIKRKLKNLLTNLSWYFCILLPLIIMHFWSDVMKSSCHTVCSIPTIACLKFDRITCTMIEKKYHIYISHECEFGGRTKQQSVTPDCTEQSPLGLLNLVYVCFKKTQKQIQSKTRFWCKRHRADAGSAFRFW